MDTAFRIRNLIDAFIFKHSTDPLIKAERATDYEIVNHNWIELDQRHVDANLSETKQYPTMSIRYQHNPMYHIIDINRDTMTTKVLTKGRDGNVSLPLSAVGRSAHYVLDEENFNGDYLNNNDYNEGCDVTYVNR